MKEFLKKIPWGIVAGLCGIIVFYTITATVVSYTVLSIIAGATTDGAGLFGTWYQTLLFVADIVFGLGLICSAGMYSVEKIKARREKEGNGQ